MTNQDRNIPLRICLTRDEWNTLDSLFNNDVYTVVEAMIAAVVATNDLLEDVKEAIEKEIQ